jgi:hypothetical protein
MAVKQEQGAGPEPGSHAGGLFPLELPLELPIELGVEPGTEIDDQPALPGGAVTFGFGLQSGAGSSF